MNSEQEIAEQSVEESPVDNREEKEEAGKPLGYSPRHNIVEEVNLQDSFPNLVNQKSKNKTGSARQSFNAEDEKNDAVPEENEEKEKETHFMKKLEVFSDESEFNTQESHNKKYKNWSSTPEHLHNRPIDSNLLPLDQVQEANLEDDENSKAHHLKKIDPLIDKMESVGGLKPRTSSLSAEEIIVEETEVKHSHFKAQSSMKMSPHLTEKYKVDEIDTKKKSEFKEDSSSSEDEVEPIPEEPIESNKETESNQNLENALLKLESENKFLKKAGEIETIDEENKIDSYKEIGVNQETTIPEVNEDDQ